MSPPRPPQLRNVRRGDTAGCIEGRWRSMFPVPREEVLGSFKLEQVAQPIEI